MKKIKLLVCISLFTFSFSLFTPCQGQSWMWGRQGSGGTKYNDYGAAVATNKNGDAYLSKQYLSQITFAPDTLQGSPNDNMYFIKYNSAGALQWAIQPHQSYAAQVIVASLATDPAGNVIIAGSFSDSLVFGPYKLYALSLATFVVKYTSNGTVIWAMQSGGNAIPGSISTDALGNSYVTGHFLSTTNFGTYTLINSVGGGQDVFYIFKLDPNGNVLWARQSTHATSLCSSHGNGVITDKSGNCYVTGYFIDSVYFGSTTLYAPALPYNSRGGVFIAKYDSAGNIKWAKQSTIPSQSSYGIGYGVAVDKSGDPYITGYFKDTMSFGSAKLITKDSSIFLAKYDQTGNFLWAEQSGNGSWMGYTVVADAKGNIYMGGVGHTDSLTFGGSTFYNPVHHNSSFLLKLNSNGSTLCGSTLTNGGGTGRNYEGLACDSTGQYVYETGDLFLDSVFCGPDILIANMGTAPYLGRWQNCEITDGIASIVSTHASVVLFPNPNNGQFTIELSALSGKSLVEIYNMFGEKIKSEELKAKSEEIDLTRQPNGIYLYRVLNEEGVLLGQGKIVLEK